MFSDTIAVVFPAFNEQDNLEPVVSEAARILSFAFSDYRMIIVDDGSTDQTPKIADMLSRSNNKILVVHHRPNRGYGASIRSGFDKALTTQMEWIFFTDSDGQFDFSQLIQLMEQAQLTKLRLVVGYRTKRADSFKRKVNGWLWTLINCALFGFWVRDLDCAFKLIHSRILRAIGPLQGEAATINPELIFKAKQAGFAFSQVPVTHRPRLSGEQTGSNIGVIVKSFISLFRLWRSIRFTPKLSGESRYA